MSAVCDEQLISEIIAAAARLTPTTRWLSGSFEAAHTIDLRRNAHWQRPHFNLFQDGERQKGVARYLELAGGMSPLDAA
jgi:hypothetical protein